MSNKISICIIEKEGKSSNNILDLLVDYEVTIFSDIDEAMKSVIPGKFDLVIAWQSYKIYSKGYDWLIQLDQKGQKVLVIKDYGLDYHIELPMIQSLAFINATPLVLEKIQEIIPVM